MDPSGKWFLVADLGADKIFIYSIDETLKILNHPEKTISLKPGAGPRHIAFHPTKSFLYVLGELDCFLYSFKWDPDSGTAAPINESRTIPNDFETENICADIHVHHSGRYVFASNRGHHSIAIFKID